MVTGINLSDDALRGFLDHIIHSELNPKNYCQFFDLVLISGQFSLEPQCEEGKKDSCQQQVLSSLKKHFSLCHPLQQFPLHGQQMSPGALLVTCAPCSKPSLPTIISPTA